MNTTFESRNLKGNIHFSDVGADGRKVDITVKTDFDEVVCGGVDWDQVTQVTIQRRGF
jgi:hypothetical protein